MSLYISTKAYRAILTETHERINTETGGILLGYINNDDFIVIEAIDPGPQSIFTYDYFEYDQAYVNHLAKKVARAYKKPLRVLGLWHRHPGSFDQFSNTDDGTNHKFAKLNRRGAVSLLVNIDPIFRLTCFHVSTPLAYQPIPFTIIDDQPELLKTIPFCLNQINKTELTFDALSARLMEMTEVAAVFLPFRKLLPEEIDDLVKMTMTDIDYLTALGWKVKLTCPTIIELEIVSPDHAEALLLRFGYRKDQTTLKMFFFDREVVYHSGLIEAELTKGETNVFH